MHGNLDALLGRLNLTGNLDVGASHELLGAGNIPHHGLLARLTVRPAHLDGGGQIGHRAGLNLKSLGLDIRQLSRHGLGRLDIDRRHDGVGQALDRALDPEGAGLGGVGRAPGDGLVGHVAVGPGDGHRPGELGGAAHPDLLGRHRFGRHHCRRFNLDLRTGRNTRLANHATQRKRSGPAAGKRGLLLAGKRAPCNGLLGHAAIRPAYRGSGRQCRKKGVGIHLAARDIELHILPLDACNLERLDRHLRHHRAGKTFDRTCGRKRPGNGGVKLVPGHRLIAHVAIGPGDG